MYVEQTELFSVYSRVPAWPPVGHDTTIVGGAGSKYDFDYINKFNFEAWHSRLGPEVANEYTVGGASHHSLGITDAEAAALCAAHRANKKQNCTGECGSVSASVERVLISDKCRHPLLACLTINFQTPACR